MEASRRSHAPCFGQTLKLWGGVLSVISFLLEVCFGGVSFLGFGVFFLGGFHFVLFGGLILEKVVDFSTSPTFLQNLMFESMIPAEGPDLGLAKTVEAEASNI